MMLKKVSAWITDADGVALPEYQIKVIDDNTIECWVPSTEGTNFKIRWKSEKRVQPKLDLRCAPYLDGVRSSGGRLGRKQIARGAYGEKVGRTSGESTIQLYLFGRRQLTDSEDIAPLTEVREDLNTIRVELTWGKSGQSIASERYREVLESKPIHERMAKKGHSGSAELAAPALRPKQPRYVFKFTPEPSLRPVVFIFRYASEDWLQAREIIPSSQLSRNLSSPEPKPTRKRARSGTSDIIDIDDLETDDEEVVVAPVTKLPNKRPRKVKDEGDVQPKLEL